MPSLTITIDMDGAAWQPGVESKSPSLYAEYRADEISMVLRSIPEAVARGEYSGSLRDTYGNTTGSWSIQEDRVMGFRRLLSKRDIVAVDPGNPFGGGVSAMPGGSSGNLGGSGGSAPHYEGPPPTSSGPVGRAHVCVECRRVFSDGGELRDHMRAEHEVRDMGFK